MWATSPVRGFSPGSVFFSSEMMKFSAVSKKLSDPAHQKPDGTRLEINVQGKKTHPAAVHFPLKIYPLVSLQLSVYASLCCIRAEPRRHFAHSLDLYASYSPDGSTVLSAYDYGDSLTPR